ncbi:MAG: hypothetical protein WCK65_13195 [Rhodospirillaceae bacterium]
MITKRIKKKFVVGGLLIGLAVTLHVGTLYLIKPQIDANAEQRLVTARAEVDKLRTQIAKTRLDNEVRTSLLPEFRKLGGTGFFATQDREAMRKTIEDAQAGSGLIGLRVAIAPESLVAPGKDMGNQYEVVSTEVAIEVEAFHDLDVFSFMNRLRNNVAGPLVPVSAVLTRSQIPTMDVLDRISNGTRVVMATARLVFDWKTVRMHLAPEPTSGSPASNLGRI